MNITLNVLIFEHYKDRACEIHAADYKFFFEKTISRQKKLDLTIKFLKSQERVQRKGDFALNIE